MTQHFRRTGGASPLVPPRGLRPRRAIFWLFVIVGFSTIPLFAHGCHGADVDHEPLLIPFRLPAEDR